jgi:hypothetical protein
MLIKKLILPSLATFLLFNGHVSAEETEPVSVRKASNTLTSSSESQFMLAPRQTTSLPLARVSYAFPPSWHCLINIGSNGHSLELEDGSHWEISPMDVYTLLQWRKNDALVITPNYSWLSSYGYYVTNKTRSSYVQANLRIGSLAYGPYAHWIIDIDSNGGHVFLENQMIWCISPEDRYILKNWAVNDHVILGLSDCWLSPFDHILINVNMDNYIRVKQY